MFKGFILPSLNPAQVFSDSGIRPKSRVFLKLVYILKIGLEYNMHSSVSSLFSHKQFPPMQLAWRPCILLLLHNIPWCVYSIPVHERPQHFQFFFFLSLLFSFFIGYEKFYNKHSCTSFLRHKCFYCHGMDSQE